jgi:ArsR family metal-binding transcriptional regulator
MKRINVDLEVFENMIAAINALSKLLCEYSSVSNKPEMILSRRDKIVALHERAKMELQQLADFEESTEIPDEWHEK